MTDQQESPPAAEEEATGQADLDERLPEPVLKGLEGLDKAQVGISAFLIMVVGAIAYSSGLNTPFHFTDRQVIVENESLHRLATAVDATVDPGMPPLAALSLAFNWWMGSGSPTIFHLFNIFLHLSNAVLVYLLARQILRKEAPEAVAMAAGLLFALHPAATHTVQQVAHRPALLGTFFILLTATLFLRATEPVKGARLRPLVLALLSFSLAWATDSSAWVLPLLLAALDFAAHGFEESGKRLRAHAAVWGLFGLLATVAFAGASAPFSLQGLLAPAAALPTYFLAIFYPLNLSVVHLPFETAELGPPLLFAGLGVLSLIALALLPRAGLGLFWFLLTILGGSLWQNEMRFSDADTYLPMVGLVLIVPWILNLFSNRQFRLAGGLAIAILALTTAAMTFIRNQVWQDAEYLWNDAAQKCPTCMEPMARLGDLRLRDGEALIQRSFEASAEGLSAGEAAMRLDALTAFEEAELYLVRAARRKGASAEVWSALGRARNYLVQRDPSKFEEAAEAFRESLRLDPECELCTLQMALLFDARAARSKLPSDNQRALDYYRRADLMDALPPEAMVRYAQFLRRMGDVFGAEILLNRAQSRGLSVSVDAMINQVQPTRQALQNLGAQIEAGARQNPGDPELVALRARQYFLQGSFLQSSYLVDETFRSRLPDILLWTLQGLNRAQMGAFDQFIQDSDTLPLVESGESAWFQMARRLFDLGLLLDAEKALAHEAELDETIQRPLFSLADLAWETGNTQQAGAFINRAAQENPTDPEPWLRLADLAIDASQLGTAHQFLTEAENRGASAETVSEKRALAGPVPEDSGRITTFIR